MKIAILTLPLHTNYGGILQAYALQTVLEREGHTVTIINKSRVRSYSKLLVAIKLPYRCFRRFILGHQIPILPEFRHNQRARQEKLNKSANRSKTDLFIKQHLHILEIDSFRDIKKKRFDAIVVGSDQVWRKKYFNSLCYDTICNAFLDFAKGWNLKRYAYAASFGSEEWEMTPEETIRCADLIKLFDKVSVREESGIYLVAEKLHRKAEWLLDPTLLLKKDDYLQLLEGKASSSESRTLFKYILDSTEETEETTMAISQKYDLDIVELRRKEGIISGVEDWISCIHKASLIVTDSFHACVFSIIFEKPFYVIINSDRGKSRITSLLKLAGLEDRIVSSSSTFTETGIRFTEVNEKLRLKRKESTNFLQSI